MVLLLEEHPWLEALLSEVRRSCYSVGLQHEESGDLDDALVVDWKLEVDWLEAP